MKIQMIHDRLAKGGQERQIIELLKSFKLRPHIQIELVFFSDEISYPEIFDLGYPVHFLKRRYKIDLLVLFQYYKLCKRFKPDIIHSWGHLSSVFAILPSTLLKIVFINQNVMDATKGLNIFNKNYFKAKLTFPFSNIIIGNSKAGLHAYNSPMWKSRCIHNGFDFRRLDQITEKDLIREELGVETDYVAIMIGTYYYKKDYPTFLKAAQAVLKTRNDITFIGVGSGDAEQYLSLINEEYRERIKLLPSRQNVEDVMNIADIGVLATFTEGISNSILEFMALSKPVVVTVRGGCEE